MFPRHLEEQKSKVLQRTAGLAQKAPQVWACPPLTLSSPAPPPFPPLPLVSPSPAALASVCTPDLQSLCTSPTPKCLHGCHLLVSQVSTQMSPPQRGFPDHLLCNSFPLSRSVTSAPFYVSLWLLPISETFSRVCLFARLVCLHHWIMRRRCRREGRWLQQV